MTRLPVFHSVHFNNEVMRILQVGQVSIIDGVDLASKSRSSFGAALPSFRRQL